MDEPTNPRFYPMCLGFVGLEATVAFTDYAKTIDSQVSGEDIVNNYSKFRKMVKKMTQERINGCVEKVADFVTKTLTVLTDVQGKNLQQFMSDIPAELRISCWAQLTSRGLDKLELAKSVHKWCAAEVLGVFGVPMGEAGIGVVPNVPGIFKAPAAAKK
jgi:hypothetical protein